MCPELGAEVLGHGDAVAGIVPRRGRKDRPALPELVLPLCAALEPAGGPG